MNHRIFATALLGLCLLAFAAPATITGRITAITGQRVTIVDEAGKVLTLTVPDTARLSAGQRVRVTYEPVGDALLATAVIELDHREPQ